MKLTLVTFIVYGLCLASGIAGSPATPIPYVVTPRNNASGRMLMMNPKIEGGGWGRCVELQPDGSLKSLWSIEWYELPRAIFLHVGAKALLRIHEVRVKNGLPKQDYGRMVALTFYYEGKVSREVMLDEIVPDFDTNILSANNGPYGFRFTENVQLLEGVTPTEVGLSNLNDEQIHALVHENVFNITTTNGERLFYTSRGELISRRK